MVNPCSQHRKSNFACLRNLWIKASLGKNHLAEGGRDGFISGTLSRKKYKIKLEIHDKHLIFDRITKKCWKKLN